MGLEERSVCNITKPSRAQLMKFWVAVPCIWFEIRINYQLDAIEYLFVYFSSTCFGLTCPSSGAMDVRIFFTYAAYGVLCVVRCRS